MGRQPEFSLGILERWLKLRPGWFSQLDGQLLVQAMGIYEELPHSARPWQKECAGKVTKAFFCLQHAFRIIARTLHGWTLTSNTLSALVILTEEVQPQE